jgi:serine/threonine protein kinase/Tfp pilus assembly protein PilF
MPQDLRHTAGSSETPALEPSAPPNSPPGYELIHEIGHGGMGVVYRARDAALDRAVAVKLLSDRYPTDSPAAQRFLSEARITGQLQHPGIPAVHQVGTLADGRPFLAMKLIKGSTLEVILKHRTDPSAERGRLLAIFEAVCQAVGYAHAHRVIHRDLKPANVMVGAFGEVQVMDWGLAKVLGEETPATVEALATEQTRAWTQFSPTPKTGSHTQAGSLVGTPAYIPPEQALGEIEKVNERTDVFGLGALLAVILTGKPPYVGESAESVRVQAVRGKLEDCFARLDASGAEPELVALCKQCLAFEPADRLADAGAVAQAVAELRAAADERARRAELDRVKAEGDKVAAELQAAEQRKRRRVQFVLASAVGLLLVSGGGIAAWLAVRAMGAEAFARQEANRAEEARSRTRAALDEVSSEAIETLLAQQRELTDRHKAFLRRTLELYADFTEQPDDDPAKRAEVAGAHLRMGKLRTTLGELTEARRAYDRAIELLTALAEEDPDRPAYRADLANVTDNLGQVFYRQADRAQAESCIRRATELFEALCRDYPEVTAYQNSQANSHVNLANCLADRREAKGAEAGYRRAIQLFESLLPADAAEGATQARLANARYNLALLLNEVGRDAESEEEYRRAIALNERLVKDFPQSHEYVRRLSSCLINLSEVLANRKAWDEAEAVHRRGLAIQEQLARDYPAIPEYRKYLGRTLASLGSLLEDRGKYDEARTMLHRSVEVRQLLARQYPKSPDYWRDLGSIYNNFAFFELQRGKPANAEAGFRRALSVQEPLVREHPTIPEYRQELGNSYGNIGSVLLERKAFAEAEEAFRSELEQDEALLAQFPDDPEYLLRKGAGEGNVAMTLSAQGKKKEALGWFGRSLEHLKAALARMKQPPPRGQEWLVNTTERRAATFQEMGSFVDALADWDEVLKLAPPEQRAGFRLRRALCLAQGGMPERAAAEAEALTAERGAPAERLLWAARVYARAAESAGLSRRQEYATRCLDLLRRAEETGQFDTQEKITSLKEDPHLASVQSRPDFRGWLADVRPRKK